MIKKGWAIKKDFKFQGVHIDTKKQQIKYDAKKYWVRFETESIIHIYGYNEERKQEIGWEEYLKKVEAVKKDFNKK